MSRKSIIGLTACNKNIITSQMSIICHFENSQVENWVISNTNFHRANRSSSPPVLYISPKQPSKQLTLYKLSFTANGPLDICPHVASTYMELFLLHLGEELFVNGFWEHSWVVSNKYVNMHDLWSNIVHNKISSLPELLFVTVLAIINTFMELYMSQDLINSFIPWRALSGRYYSYTHFIGNQMKTPRI